MEMAAVVMVGEMMEEVVEVGEAGDLVMTGLETELWNKSKDFLPRL